jgi:acyl-CoA thioesterase-1
MSTRLLALPGLLRWAAILVPTFFIFGCGGAERKSPPAAAAAAKTSADSAGDGAAAAAPAGERKVVLFVGTSLTAAYGLDPDLGFPARIQEKIDSAGLPWEAVNAGVSGETSRDARGRMKWLLAGWAYCPG